jgi:hypothetical protein
MNGYKVSKGRKARMTPEGWRVDRVKDAKSGWYDWHDDGTHGPLVTPGSSPAPYVVASMRDTPSERKALLEKPPRPIRNENWAYENYTIAKAGKQKGLVYGGLQWGFRIDAAGHLNSFPIRLLNAPTKVFNAAVDKSNTLPGNQKLGPFHSA